MNKIVIKPYDVVSHADLTEIEVDKIPSEGDPLEINKELYFVCEQNSKQQTSPLMIGVIPLVVRNPAKVLNIKEYIECLSVAHRKVLFKNKKGICEFDNCDEMTIS